MQKPIIDLYYDQRKTSIRNAQDREVISKRITSDCELLQGKIKCFTDELVILEKGAMKKEGVKWDEVKDDLTTNVSNFLTKLSNTKNYFWESVWGLYKMIEEGAPPMVSDLVAKVTLDFDELTDRTHNLVRQLGKGSPQKEIVPSSGTRDIDLTRLV